MIFAYSSSSFAFEKGDRAELTKDFEVKLKNSKKSRDLDKGKKVKIQSCTGNTCIATYGFYTFEIKKNALKKFERSSRTRTKKKKSSGGLFNLFKKKDTKKDKKKEKKENKSATNNTVKLKSTGFVNPVCECTTARCLKTSGFGWRKHPITGKNAHHDGEDISLNVGTKIIASAAGTIVYAKTMGGYGKTVDILHENGLKSRYAHLSRIVRASGWVNQGEVIGYGGSTGRSTGAHLHFEILKGKDRLPPKRYLTFKHADLGRKCPVVKTTKKSVKKKARSTKKSVIQRSRAEGVQ